MASFASSLDFVTLTPNSLTLSNPKPSAAATLSLFSFITSKSISISPARLLVASPSRFVRNVAVSSDLEQDDFFLSDAEEVEPAGYSSDDPKLFVGNLPFSVDSSTLAGLFARAGNVEMVEVIYDRITGRSRGFAFVTMSTGKEAKAAAQQFNGYELEGRALRVNSGPPPEKREFPKGGGNFANNTNKVYVGNLSWSVDDSELEALFGEQGKVVEAKVIYDRDTGRSKGFGFVTYSSADEVNNAIESLDGTDLGGRSIRVSVAESRPQRQF